MIPQSGSRFSDQDHAQKRANEMQDEPTPTELLKAVADFLRNEITPAIKGHNAFKLRVGINALDLVTRQLALEEESDAAEAARLKQLLRMVGSLMGAEPHAVSEDSERRGRPANAGAVGTSVANHDGQARGRSAELRVVQARAQIVGWVERSETHHAQCADPA